MNKKQIDLVGSFFIYLDNYEMKRYTPIEKMFPDAYIMLSNTLSDYSKNTKSLLLSVNKEDEELLYEDGYEVGVLDGILSVVEDLKLSIDGLTEYLSDNYLTWEIPKTFLRDIYQDISNHAEHLLYDYYNDFYISSYNDSYIDSNSDNQYNANYKRLMHYEDYVDHIAKSLASDIGKQAWIKNSARNQGLKDFYDEFELDACSDIDSYAYFLIELMEEMGLLRNIEK